MPEPGVCAIVLAAGQGSRYRAAGGADKLLAASLAVASSPPVLAATLANLRGVAERLLVVTRADNLPLRDWLSANVADCVWNTGYTGSDDNCTVCPEGK